MFNDILFVTMKPHVSLTRYNEVDEQFQRNLGQRIETDVRNRLDPGVTFRGHRRAQSVKVELTDVGNLRIRSDRPEKAVLKPDRGSEPGKPVLDREDTVNDLFKPSSGVPMVVTANGVRRAAFRTVRDVDLFGRAQEQQDAEVKRIVDHAVQVNAVDMMTQGIRDVERRYPSDAIGSEELPEADS